jgi:hypothetical protein
LGLWKRKQSKRQRLKPDDYEMRNGTAEAVPYKKVTSAGWLAAAARNWEPEGHRHE